MKAYAKGALLSIALLGLVACGGDGKKDSGGEKATGGGEKWACGRAGRWVGPDPAARRCQYICRADPLGVRPGLCGSTGLGLDLPKGQEW